MNALAFTRIFPTRDEPSRGLYNLNRFKALSKFCSTLVVAPVPAWRRLTSPSQWFRRPSDCYEGLEVIYPTYWMAPRLAPQWHAETMYRSLRSDLNEVGRRFEVDVILGAFAYPDVVVAARLARDLTCPLVALVMGSDINELAYRPALQPQIRRALSQAECVIALSSALKDRVRGLGISENRIMVQHNGVDGARFSIRDQTDARRRLGLRLEGRVACFIGNLVPEKGPDTLIDALGHLDPSCLASLEVVFVGDGRLRRDLSSRVEQLGLTAKVHFVGRRPPGEIPVWMTAADFLCLPSRREGCPNVVLEALACGRPVVANAVGGVPELLNNRNGLTVPSENAAAFATAITLALKRTWDPTDLRASLSSFTWENLGKTFHDVLSKSLHQYREKVQMTSKLSAEALSRIPVMPLTKK